MSVNDDVVQAVVLGDAVSEQPVERVHRVEGQGRRLVLLLLGHGRRGGQQRGIFLCIEELLQLLLDFKYQQTRLRRGESPFERVVEGHFLLVMKVKIRIGCSSGIPKAYVWGERNKPGTVGVVAKCKFHTAIEESGGWMAGGRGFLVVDSSKIQLTGRLRWTGLSRVGEIGIFQCCFLMSSQ